MRMVKAYTDCICHRFVGIELALLASIVLAGSSFPRAIRLQKPLPIALSVLAATGLYNFGVAFANRR